ncbi:MAG: helix-turn-helix domain-containing protein [Kiritimatiellae bacterium]|jgi:transposase|nr:helix-turn-helix domain-containing protein [Kiritimatiellia bacterium]
MLTIQLTEAELQKINIERFYNPSPIVQKRLHAIYLKGKQYSHETIADILEIHLNSVTNYLKMYQAGGLEQVKRVNYGTNTSQLDLHRVSLEEEFRQHPPVSTNEAIQKIETLTGIRRSPTRVTGVASLILNFLHDGFSHRFFLRETGSGSSVLQ